MNLIKVISNEESIGGLEITDNSLRFVILKKDHTGIKALALAEEKLTDKEGLTNESVFVSKLAKFAKTNKIKYIIITIPSDNIFVKTFNFPVAMPDEKVAESMRLTIDLQLPKKPEEIYCDWMKTEDDSEKKTLLSYVDKKYMDRLLAAVKKTGLKVVAIETHAMSLARAIKQVKNEAVLLVEKGTLNTSFTVLVNNNVFLSQSAPNEKIGVNLGIEITKIINYQDWINVSIKNLILIGNFSEAETKKLPLKINPVEMADGIKLITKDSKWLTVLGAALRGLITRKDDKIISLMETGTEKAYKLEKANSIANFFIGISVGLSIFFVAAFVATWSLIVMMQNNYNKQITSFNLLPSSENSSLLNDKATAFNSLVSQASAIVRKEAYWSKVVAEAKNKTVDGVTINNMSLPEPTGVYSVTGTADSREDINNLKKSFESSDLFTDVNIPLNNLGKKTEIPFSMTFQIKSNNLIYTK